MKNRDLKPIGYWFNEDFADSPNYKDLPKAQDCVDPTWDRAERQMIINYLRAGKRGAQARGFSRCRFCSIPNGSAEQDDGVYVWPEGLYHYLEEHGVRLPKEFVEHVRKSS